MQIVACEPGSSHKTGSISGLSKQQIAEKLGLKPKSYRKSDGDGKVAYDWNFTVNGTYCAIWDWKGSGASGAHSTFGEPVLLKTIFGSAYRSGSF